MDGLKEVFHSFFASTPHDWHLKNQISGFEGYYASIVYAYVTSLGYLVIPEETTNHGQVEMTVQTSDGIWLFEFKFQGQTNRGKNQKSPLLQLQEKDMLKSTEAVGNRCALLELFLILCRGILFSGRQKKSPDESIG